MHTTRIAILDMFIVVVSMLFIVSIFTVSDVRAVMAFGFVMINAQLGVLRLMQDK